MQYDQRILGGGGEWLKISGRDRLGGGYEFEGGGQDSRTGEWGFGIRGGASKRNTRVKTEKGEDPSA